MEPSIRGQNFLDVKRYLTDKFGPDAMDKVLAQLPSSSREIVSSNILAVSWVKETAFIDFLVTVENIFSSQAANISGNLGYYSALRSLPKFYKIFIKFGDMDFLFARGQNFWKQVHDHGRIEIVKNKDNSAVAFVYENKTPHKIMCRYVSGYFRALLEMCGAKDVAINETQCVVDGADCCKFSAVWKM